MLSFNSHNSCSLPYIPGSGYTSVFLGGIYLARTRSLTFASRSVLCAPGVRMFTYHSHSKIMLGVRSAFFHKRNFMNKKQKAKPYIKVWKKDEVSDNELYWLSRTSREESSDSSLHYFLGGAT